jgi:hypothetical protein
MKITHAVLSLCTLILLSGELVAQDYAASVKLSTLGVNLEVCRSLGPSFNVHLGGSIFSYTYESGVQAGEDYEMSAKLNLSSVALLGDWYPFESTSLHVTGGAVLNLNKPVVTATPTISKMIGGDVYNKENLGTIGIDLSFNKIAPYVGIGIGNPTAGDKGFGFVMDIGAYYQGPPKIAMTANGLLAPSASPEQEAIVETNLNWFTFYPVVSLGLSYKF